MSNMTIILVVDDDDDMRETLRLILEKEGYRLLTASNGNEVEEICQTDRPGLVITDIIMPDKDGLETITSLQRNYPDMKIIAISGAGSGRGKEFNYLECAELLGANRVLGKPFSQSDILNLVKEVLNEIHQDSASPQGS